MEDKNKKNLSGIYLVMFRVLNNKNNSLVYI